MNLAVEEPVQTSTPQAPTLKELFEELESPLLLYAHKLVQNSDTAQDLVQDAFLRLHPRLAEVQQPRPWLYRTVHNLAMNHHRKFNRVLQFRQEGDPDDNQGIRDGIAEPVDEAPLPDEQIEHLENVGLAMLCLNSLDELARKIVRLKFVEELSYKEISVRTGLSVGNVGFKLHHALKDLAMEMERNGVTP
jgi:RNA polymerase sigma factor (sigma-70 family)